MGGGADHPLSQPLELAAAGYLEIHLLPARLLKQGTGMYVHDLPLITAFDSIRTVFSPHNIYTSHTGTFLCSGNGEGP